MNTSRQAFLYLQASVIGTLANFFSRFLFAELVNFGWSIILANLGRNGVCLLVVIQTRFWSPSYSVAYDSQICHSGTHWPTCCMACGDSGTLGGIWGG